MARGWRAGALRPMSGVAAGKSAATTRREQACTWSLEFLVQRLSIVLLYLGAFGLVAGVFSWMLRMPSTDWVRSGYEQCLWAYSYRVTSETRPDWRSIDPNWDPSHASCETGISYAEEARQHFNQLTTGSASLPPVKKRRLIFITPPFLNGLGTALLLIGAVLWFARSQAASAALGSSIGRPIEEQDH
jgi:hypothetical protein